MNDDSTEASRVLNLDKASGKLVLDEDGHTRFLPSTQPSGDDGKSELQRIEAFLSQELKQTIEDYAERWRLAAENVLTYKAEKIHIPESGESILPSPIARIPADQIIAFETNTILRPKPVVSISPYFNEDVQVVVPMDVPGPPGQPPQQIPTVVTKSSEDVAHGLEVGLEFKNREKLGIHKLIYGAVTECVRLGTVPVWIKVIADPQKKRTALGPKVNGAFLDLTDKDEYEVDAGEVVTIHRIPWANAIMPVDEDDADESPWWAERLRENRPSDIIFKQASGEYFLLTAEDAKVLAKNTTESFNPYKEELRAKTEARSPSRPRPRLDMWQVWFYWFAKYIDPKDGQKKTKRLNLIADFHLTGERACNIYLNEYEHQCRPVVPCYQIPDPDSDSGSCTVGILKYYQRAATHVVQAEYKNAFHANNFTYWYDPNGDTADYFDRNKTIGPGEQIPGKFGEDWGVTRVGAEHYSLLPLRQALIAEAKEASNVSSYQAGQDIPGRTPAMSISQIMQAGLQQPMLFMKNLNDCFAKVYRLYLLTCKQYQPMGETIPVKDPTTKAILEVPFRHPVGDMLSNFRISLTAADEMMAKEHEFDQLGMLKNTIMQDGTYVAQIAGPMMSEQATPATVALFQKMIERNERITRRMAAIFRADEDDFDVTKEVDALVKEREEALEAAANAPPPPPPAPPPPKVVLSGKLSPEQVASAAAQDGITGPSMPQGGPSAGQNPGQTPSPGGPVSGAGGQANPPGNPGVGGQPGIPPHPVPRPAQGVPQPPGGAVQ